MLVFDCPACGMPLKVKDKVAGKKVKCPGCGQAVVAAAERTAASAASGPSSRRHSGQVRWGRAEPGAERRQ
jgi:uncharacterized Zn finger protein (UPF0148 family)